MEQKLRIGIPNGSLVDKKRGDLKWLMDRARIYSENIGTNKPPEITNIPWLEAMVGRPQELPAFAARGIIDIFFCGDDWAKECELRGKRNEKLIGLGIGRVDIVFAEKEVNRDKSLIRVVSEYPRLARKYSSEKYGIPETDIPIVKAGEDLQIKKGVMITDSYGATEAKVYYGLDDAVVEAAQSGSTLRNYSLTITGRIMDSECSLYCSERIKDDAWKMKKARRIKMMLEGAINAQGKDLVIFNVGNDDMEKMMDYIRKNQIFGNEETVIKGRTMSEITLELPTTDRQKPVIDVIGDLKDLGALSIEGIPLSYSVR